MTREEHLLLHIMEECDELSHRVSKALRFGLDERQAAQPYTNRERILAEFVDLVAVMEMNGFTLSMVFDEEIRDKREKVERYLGMAKERGTLI